MIPAEIREAKAKVAAFRKAQRKARPKPDKVKVNRGRDRDPGFLAYLRRQPCEARHVGGCDGQIQAAHIRYRDARYPNSAAAGVKNHDRWANPLCAAHHALQHHVGNERRFWSDIDKDAYSTAAEHYHAYQHGSVERRERERG